MANTQLSRKPSCGTVNTTVEQNKVTQVNLQVQKTKSRPGPGFQPTFKTKVQTKVLTTDFIIIIRSMKSEGLHLTVTQVKDVFLHFVLTWTNTVLVAAYTSLHLPT